MKQFEKACDVLVALAIGYFSGHLLNLAVPLPVAIIGALLIAIIVFAIIKQKPIS